MLIIETIFDAETNETKIMEREATEAEVAADLAIKKLLQERVKLQNEAALKKAALLEKLGITEDEAKLLLS